jgi:hypothetical protein
MSLRLCGKFDNTVIKKLIVRNKGKTKIDDFLYVCEFFIIVILTQIGV